MGSAPVFPYPGGVAGEEPPDPTAGAPGHFAWSRWIKQFVKNLDSQKVAKTGDTMTGVLNVNQATAAGSSLTISPTAGMAAMSMKSNDGAANIYLRAKAGQPRSISIQNEAGTPRWFIGTASNEDGAEGGTNLIIAKYNDAGAGSGTVLTFDRKTGILTLGTGSLILPATTAPTSANQAVTKAYIDRRIRNNDHHMAWRKAYTFDAGGLINLGADLTAAGFTYVSSINATMYSGTPETDKVATFGVYRDVPGDFILRAKYTDDTPVVGSHVVMIAVTGTAT